MFVCVTDIRSEGHIDWFPYTVTVMAFPRLMPKHSVEAVRGVLDSVEIALQAHSAALVRIL